MKDDKDVLDFHSKLILRYIEFIRVYKLDSLCFQLFLLY